MRIASRLTSILLLTAAALGLQACGGGGSSDSAGDGSGAADAAAELDTDVDLSGSVGDGPVAGAQLTVRSSAGNVLQNVLSSQKAGYAVLFKTKGKYYPLLVEASGGTDLVTNLPPDFVLASAVTAPSNRSIANLNPFTTLAVSTAKQMPGGFTSADVQSALATVVAKFNSGLTTLASSGPMSTQITDSNLAEIVKSSETLAETFRRTNAALIAARGSSTVSAVIDALGADLVDGQFDGKGGARADATVSAIASIVAAQTLVEAMTNTLRVNGQSATSALDNTINMLASKPMQSPTASLPATAGMIERAKAGVAGAIAIAPTPALTQLQSALGALTPGMLPADVAAVLPSAAPAALDPAITRIGAGLAADVQAVNAAAAGSTTTSQPPATSGTQPTTNSPPVISGTPSTNVLQGTAYRFQPTASDPDGNTLSFSITNRPAWASFDAATGTLSGTPGPADVGTYANIAISVSDGQSSAALPAFVIAVQALATGSATLSWTPPTTNTDGSVLSNLAGYQVYWGTASKNYSSSVQLNNAGCRPTSSPA